VFDTLYRPQFLTRGATRGAGGVRGTSHRHSSYIAPTITIHTPPAPSPDARPQSSSLLNNFDEAFADYKQLENKKKLKTNIETDRYFDNLAALLREL